jgi:N-acetylneuraminic acid mutarotase
MPKFVPSFAAVCLALFAFSCSKHNSSKTVTMTTAPPFLSITQFSPQETEIDSLVTITGTDFSDTAGNDIVTFNDTVAVVKSATSTQLVVVVPSGASAGKIGVKVNGQSAASAQNFVVGDHWTLMKAYPGSTTDLTVFYFDAGSNFFIGLGNNNSGPWQFISWQYDPLDSGWTQKTPFPTMNGSVVASFSISGEGYALDGTSSFWKYDTASGNWTQMDSFPSAWALAGGMTAFGINGKGYLLVYGSNSVWQYDPVTNAWDQLGNFPWTLTSNAACFVIGNYAYVGTGNLNINTSSATDSFYQYDPSTNTWTQKGNFPGGPRASATGFTIGNFGYLGTGLDINGHYLSDFWQYDPTSDSWTRKSDFGGGGRFAAAAFSGANQGYMGFGQGENQITPYEVTNVFFDLWQYQP